MGKLVRLPSYRFLRLFIEFFAFLVLIAATTLLLRPLQITMHNRMVELRDYGIAQAEVRINRKIEYSSMGFSLFGSLDIRNIRIYERYAEPVITLSRIRLSYSLLKLLRGDLQDTFSVIDLNKPVIILDRERDADLWQLLFPGRDLSLTNMTKSLAGLVPRDLQVRINDGICTLVDGKNRFTAKEIGVTASVRGEEAVLQGQWKAGILWADSAGRPFKADFSGKITGELYDNLSRGLITLTVPSIETDRFKLRPLMVNCILGDKRIEIRKVDDMVPLDLSLEYDLESGDISGSFRAEDFLPGELVSFARDWEPFSPWLSVRGSGSASFQMKAPGELRYEMELSGALPEVNPWGIEKASFSVKGRGDQHYVNLDFLSVNVPQGALVFSGDIGLAPLSPNGTIRISDFSLSGTEGVNGRLSVNTLGSEINVFGERLSLGSVMLSGLNVEIQRESRGFTFAASALRYKNLESYEDVKPREIALEGSFDLSPQEVQVSVDLNAFPLMDLFNMAKPFGKIPDLNISALNAGALNTGALNAGLADPLKDLAITATVFISADFEHFLYNAPRFVIANEGSRDVFAVFSLSGTDRRFDLQEGQITWPDGKVMVFGFADFSNPRNISFSLQSSYLDISYGLDGTIMDQDVLEIKGAYDLRAHVEGLKSGSYAGHIELSALPIPFRDRFAHLTLFSSMSWESAEKWYFDINRLELRDLVTPTSLSTAISFRGRLDQEEGNFWDIRFDDQRGLLSGDARVFWAGLKGDLRLDGREGESLYLDGELRKDALNLNADISKFQLSRLLLNSLDAEASGSLRVSWSSWEAFDLELGLSAFTARLGDQPLQASGRVALDEEALLAEDVALVYGGLTGSFPSIRMNLRESAVETDGRVWGTAMSRDMDISFAAAASFSAPDSWFDIAGVLQAFDGTVLLKNFRLDTLETAEPMEFAFSRSDSLLLFHGGPNEMIRLQLSREGIFYAGLAAPSPIQGVLTGTITGGTIDARSTQMYVDLGALWSFVPFDQVRFTGGIVNLFVEIKGPLGDPSFVGVAQGRDVRIRIPDYLTEDIGPVPITLMLEDNEMRFGPVMAPVGSGQGQVSGWFRFDRWIPSTFSIDIRAAPEDAIPFGVNIEGVRARGLVSGQLEVSIIDNNMMVTGELTGYDTEITLEDKKMTADAADAGGESRFIPVRTSLVIRAGRKVEFLWPNAVYPIIRAYADIGTGLKITTNSDTKEYSLVGDVRLRSGEIFYIQRSFYIREGTLYFNENEIRFLPQISARAEIRDRTDDGPVTISLIIDKSPLESFAPRFETNPSLSQNEIISLLGQDLTGTAVEGRGGEVLGNMLSASSDFFAQFTVVRRLEKYIRDLLFLDMFSFRTQVLQNAVLQATGLRSPVERESWGRNYFDNTAVFLGKYIGSDMFFQSMFSLRYDENKQTFGGYTFEPEIGIELRSPLFDIRWDIVFRHPEHLFIDDNSITLTWRWTF
ncbi:MAG: translocation/assembly module TamB domain-containing protein [Spirochaetaceae bacterium]|jgi:hypothetical protein|nr:translocation/assembly module TamB domain-containing protein [Spirochaetaceae bacterium]